MNIKTIKMDIKGMTCDHCATSIAKILNADGILKKNVSYRRGSADVSYDVDKISSEQIVSIINDTRQYHVTDTNEENDNQVWITETPDYNWWWVCCLCCDY